MHIDRGGADTGPPKVPSAPRYPREFPKIPFLICGKILSRRAALSFRFSRLLGQQRFDIVLLREFLDLGGVEGRRSRLRLVQGTRDGAAFEQGIVPAIR